MDWLGKLIVEEKPDIVVQVGDFGDFPSLSSYDKGKKSFEGRKYADDVRAVIEGQTRLFKPINEYNKQLRIKKLKKYQPRMVMLGGNHCEGRINRAINEDRKLEGTISIEDQKFEDFGWEYSSFKDIIEIEGIYFSHYFTKGLMDSPISGNTSTLGGNILKEMKDNAFQGHTHYLSIANSVLPNGRQIWGGSVGCYFEHSVDYVSKRAQAEWWRGVVMLSTSNKEIRDIDLIHISTLKKEYK